MMSLTVLVGFLAAGVAPWLTKRWPARSGVFLAVIPFCLAIFFAYLLSVHLQPPLNVNLPWGDLIGLRLSFNFDGLSLLFAALISAIGFFVTVYAGGYLKGHPDLGRFYFWLLFFMAAMLGVVLSDNLILLFIFWELTSISSFFLIGFKHDEQRSRDAALQALLVTGSGGLAMLAGFIMIGEAGGTYELTKLLRTGALLRENPVYLPALLLVLGGAFTKSAQFPFHFWLPNAMEAPTPVSAYLHSATMVKAGVYLLARLLPVLGGTPEWQGAVVAVGALTTAVGGMLAIGQTDLKRLLAYSTVSALGTMTMLLGLGDKLALKTAIVFITAHAFYKGALFLVAGAIDHEAGTRDVRILGGLGRSMPVSAFSGALAALSMAGVLPLFGFVAKELLYERSLVAAPWILGVVIFAALVNVCVAGLVAVTPFWRRPSGAVRGNHVEEAPLAMLLGPAALALFGLLAGIFPGASGRLLEAAVAASAGEPVTVKLTLWHGLTPAFTLSLLTLAAGIAIYAFIRPIRGLFETANRLPGPETLYKTTWKATLDFASLLVSKLQNGYLRTYLMTIILTVIGGVSLTLLLKGGWLLPDEIIPPRFYEIGLVLIILVAAFNATISKSRLSAVASMGAVGFSIALLYLLFGAPDLAMTQFLIESLTVILFVVAFYHLPGFSNFTPPAARIRDVVVSLFAGGLMTVLVLSSLGGQVFPPISDYFAEHSYTLGHGRNVVNVILVDFRGIDTLGEITVLGTAAVGVYALLKLRRNNDHKGDEK